MPNDKLCLKTITPEGVKREIKLSDVVDGIKENKIFGYGGVTIPTSDKTIQNFFNSTPQSPESDDVIVLDSQWVKTRFMTPLKNIDKNLMFQMIKSTAHFKFRDTTIGGSFCCNPPPQINRYADIRADDFTWPFAPHSVKNKEGALQLESPSGKSIHVNNQLTFNSVTPYVGMGRWYSEAIDDGHQYIYLQFGLPRFNGILDYLINSIDYVDATIANKGRIPTTYQPAKLLGNVLMFLAFPVLSTLILVAKQSISGLLGEKPFNYYYMEPTMHLYWACVNQVANQFATQMGILVPVAVPSEQDPTQKAKDMISTGKAFTFSKESIDGINRMFAPNAVVFGETNYIDVYALMMRSQNYINEILKLKPEEQLVQEFQSVSDVQSYILAMMNQKKEGFTERVNRYLYLYDDAVGDVLNTPGSPYGKKEDKEPKKVDPEQEKKDKEILEKQREEVKKWSMSGMLSVAKKAIDGYMSDWARTFDSTVRGAGAQAVFQVQYTGQTSDSFSNSYGEISTGQKIKSMQQGIRNAKFNFSGGKTGVGIVDQATEVLTDIGNGLLDAATFGFSNIIRGMASGGYTDIPKAWEDSSTNIGSVSYTMDLVAPYGHVWSRFQNIIVPLSMLLAGALPLRVGSAGYTSPFLCSIFSKSVQKIRLGMITDISISRGITNLGYTTEKKINAISVTITVSDFAGKVSAPINNSIFQGKFRMFFEQVSGFSDYIDLIGGRDYHDSEWIWNRVKKNFSNMAKGYVGAWGSSTGGIYSPAVVGDAIWNSPVSLFFTNWAPTGQ